MKHIWTYRGHRLQQLEWGLWRSANQPTRCLLCYRPQGRSGSLIRRWAVLCDTLTLADLQDHVRAIRANLNRQRIGMEHTAQIEPVLTEYLADLQRRNLSPKHIHDTKRDLNRYLDAAGIEWFNQITRQNIETFLSTVAAESSARTHNKIRTCISTWLRWCVARNYTDSNPAELIQKATQERTHKPFLMPDDMICLIDNASPQEAAVWVFLALTGVRWGSLVSMNADSITDESITFDTKRRQQFTLRFDDGCPLWQPELADVARYILKTPLNYDRLHDTLIATLEVCKLRRVTLHSFRHSFASWLTMAGYSDRDIAAWLHHASPSTTEQWYGHLRPRGKADENKATVFNMCSHLISVVQRKCISDKQLGP